MQHSGDIPRRSLAAAVMALVCLVLAAGVAMGQDASRSPIDFADLLDAPKLADGAAVEAADWLHRSLRAGSAQPAPAGWQRDHAARMAVASVSHGGATARSVLGRGRGLEAAMRDALGQAMPLLARPDAWPNAVSVPRTVGLESIEPDTLWTRVDLISTVRLQRDLHPASAPPTDWSVTGLAGDGLVLLPDHLMAGRLTHSRMTPAALAASRPATRQAGPWLPVPPVIAFPLGQAHLFTTQAAFSDGRGVWPLYRGRRLVDRVSREDLLAAAMAGGEYLARCVDDRGRFVYEYDPRPDLPPDPRRSGDAAGAPDLANRDGREDGDDVRGGPYNILRHAGTTFAMYDLLSEHDDAPVRAAAERAMRFLLDACRPWPQGPQPCLVVVEEGEVKLGGNALAILAIAERIRVTGDRTHLPEAQGLARWIVSVTGPDGRFRVHKMTYPQGVRDDFESLYYPGEAILALCRLHRLDGDPQWLQTASAAARWIIQGRDRSRGVDDLPHDHWLLYGLNDLHRLQPQAYQLEQALRITRAITASQHRGKVEPDWRGGYYVPPRSTPTAIRNEGLAAAYLLARDYHREAELPRLREAIELGLRFNLQLTVRPETSMFYADPLYPLGGMPEGLALPEIRIDYVQHAMSAYLAWARVLQAEDDARPLPAER